MALLKQKEGSGCPQDKYLPAWFHKCHHMLINILQRWQKPVLRWSIPDTEINSH